MFEWFYSRTCFDNFLFYSDEVVITRRFYGYIQQENGDYNV